MRRFWLPLVLLLAVLWLPAYCGTSDLGQHLKDQYEGKIFLLRGLPSGHKLHYGASGALIGNPPSGTWTTDGFVVIDDTRVDSQKLVINGRRMLVVSRDEFQFVAESSKERKKASKIEINAVIGSSAGARELDALMAKIFLTDADSLLAFVPSYWRTCVSAGLYEVTTVRGKTCHLGLRS